MAFRDQGLPAFKMGWGIQDNDSTEGVRFPRRLQTLVGNMKKIKNWFHGAWISLTMALGVQYARPPVMEEVHPPQAPIVEATPAPISTPIVLPSSNNVPQMILKRVTGATSEELQMIKKGFEQANIVLASECFHLKVIKGKYTEDNGQSPGQIWNHISKAPIEVNAEMFYGTWKQNYIYKTMGYDIGDGVVYMNRFYVDKPFTVMSLSTHEGEGHGQGYHHYYVKSTSIPYQWNDFMEDCYK